MTSTERVRGACLCEAVTFSFVLPTTFCGHCHCTLCQRSHGAGFVTWIGARRDGFALHTGESALTRFSSSEHGSRSFCKVCGSSLFCELEHEPDTIDIVLANLIDPIDKAPNAHVYYSNRVSWLEVRDELPKLGGKTGMERLD